MGGSRHAGGGSTDVDELGELVDEVHEDERVLRDHLAQLGGVGDVVVGAGEKGDADYAEGYYGAAEKVCGSWKAYICQLPREFHHVSLPEVGEPVDCEVEDEAPVEERLLRRAHRPQLGVALERLDPRRPVEGQRLRVDPHRDVLEAQVALLPLLCRR